MSKMSSVKNINNISIIATYQFSLFTIGQFKKKRIFSYITNSKIHIVLNVL